MMEILGFALGFVPFLIFALGAVAMFIFDPYR